MITRTAPDSPLSRVAILALALVVAWLATSCGQHLTTAPDSAHPRAASKPAFLSGVDDQIVVTLAPGADANAVASAYGATLVESMQGIAVLEPPQSQTTDDIQTRVRSDVRVRTVEHNTILRTAEAEQKSWAFDDGHGNYQTYSEQPAALSVGLTRTQDVSMGSGVLVAVLDTGIDPAHPVLAGRIVNSWNFIDNNPDPTEVRMFVDSNNDGVVDGAFGHGTHVAGILRLAAPRSRLLVGRVLDSDGNGDVATVAAGVRWAVANGARVINMSLGMISQSITIESAIYDAWAKGVIVVASAGNWGSSTPVDYPASSSHVIAVAADDAYAQPASFTSYGSFVDLCAPGVAVRSTYPGGGYRLWSGTSMSAPFVAGTAARLLCLHPQWNLQDIINCLSSTAVGLNGANWAQTGNLGAGMLNVAGALTNASLQMDAPLQRPNSVKPQ